MILITGMGGYIGSHMAKFLDSTATKYVGIDKDKGKNFPLLKNAYVVDMCNIDQLEDFFKVQNKKERITSVFHFAAYKSIPDSIKYPTDYFHNNIVSTANLMALMKAYNIPKIVFSSTCAVYGTKESPISETAVLNPENPYAKSKVICEEIIKDSTCNYSILRYFNPIGTYNGLKDFSKDSLNYNLNKNPFVIYGNDYNTPDGTPIRDFIEIDELINAHITALLWDNVIVNIGTGKGKSVLSLAKELNIPYVFGSRREGDCECVFADATKYKNLVKSLVS